MVNKEFWQNKKVLVTGHSGFKGAWLSIILNNFGSKVYGLSSNTNVSKIYELHNKNYLEKEFIIDIKDNSEDLIQIFKTNEFDYIFHLAAQAYVSNAKKDPRETLLTNILGTYNILELNQTHQTSKNLVISTTDKVYLNPSNMNIESDPLGGFEFYGVSKASAEMVIEAYSNFDIDFNIRVVRSGNVLGPGDYGKDRLLTDVLNSLNNNLPIVIRNPESIRPWQDILDSLSGYLLVAENCSTEFKYDKFNLNAEINANFTVIEVVNMLVDNWPNKTEVKVENNSNLLESEILRLDSSKAKSTLGWSEKISMKEIITKLVEWETNIPNIEKTTKNQINHYFKN
tara:strand:+ start:266 stop:1291 length:1026 start_codon:yes stop_codon:yes gene_type:complete